MILLVSLKLWNWTVFSMMVIFFPSNIAVTGNAFWSLWCIHVAKLGRYVSAGSRSFVKPKYRYNLGVTWGWNMHALRPYRTYSTKCAFPLSDQMYNRRLYYVRRVISQWINQTVCSTRQGRLQNFFTNLALHFTRHVRYDETCKNYGTLLEPCYNHCLSTIRTEDSYH